MLKALFLVAAFASLPASPALASSAPPAPAPQLPIAQAPVDSGFRHDRHSAFRCQDCHSMQDGHGVLVVATPSDCQSCHHAPRQLDGGCAACHQPDELRNVVAPQTRLFPLSVLEAPVEREVDFSHDVHRSRDCVECHQGSAPELDASTVDCNGCHQEHHQPTSAGCAACHRPPRDDAHTLDVHQSCSGSGCHVDPPFQRPPPSRTGCLWCHEEQVDHQPQGVCTECHLTSTVPSDPRDAARTMSGSAAGISPRRSGRISRLPALFGRGYLFDVHPPRS